MMVEGQDDEEEDEDAEEEEEDQDASWCVEEEVEGAWIALRALDWLPLVQAIVTDVIKRYESVSHHPSTYLPSILLGPLSLRPCHC